MSHPSVRDTGVIGLPNDESGELPLAFVVFKPGLESTDPEEIIKHVANKVAPFKKLRGGVKVVSEIPRNASGKILRRKLKEMLQEMLRPTIDIIGSEARTTISKYDIEIKNNILVNKWDTSNIPVMPFGEYMMDILATHGDKTCIINSENKDTRTFKDIIAQTKSVGSGLTRKGFVPGDTLAVYGINKPDFLVAILAVACIGGKISLYNPASTKDEIILQMKRSENVYLLFPAPFGDKFEETLKECLPLKVSFLFQAIFFHFQSY